jgi:hypothetical protein
MKEAKARRAREQARKLGQVFFRVLVFGQLNHLALPLTRLSFFIFHFGAFIQAVPFFVPFSTPPGQLRRPVTPFGELRS